MSYLDFKNNIPVTRIPFLDNIIAEYGYKDCGDRISVVFTYDGKEFCADLNVDGIYLDYKHILDSKRSNYENIPMVNYGDSKTFFEIIKNSYKFTITINKVDVAFEYSPSGININFHGINFFTNLSTKTTLSQFLDYSNLILKLLIDKDMDTDIRSIARLANSYERFMIYKLKLD